MATEPSRMATLDEDCEDEDEAEQPQEDFDPHRVEGWEEEAEDDTDWRKAVEETMALDPAVQLAEEDRGMPQRVKGKLRLTPESVKAEIRKAHHVLGHPGRDVLLRMAKAAGRSDDHLTYIRWWKCPVCLRRERPGATPPATSHARAQEFNVLVVWS